MKETRNLSHSKYRSDTYTVKPVKEKKLLKGLVVKYNKVNGLLDRCSRKEVSSIMKGCAKSMNLNANSRPLMFNIGWKERSWNVAKSRRNAADDFYSYDKLQ